MFLADYHTHSLCSPDGYAPLTDMAQAAWEQGLDELCLTDHCDLLTADGHLDFSFRWAPIEEQFAQARPRFEGRLTLRMGLELGEGWEAPDFAQKLSSHPRLDFVIASAHNLSRAEGGGKDFYFFDYRSDEDCYAVLDQYFRCMEDMVKLSFYDCLGHVIYPLRYMNERDGNHAALDRYEDQLRRIFAIVIDKGKSVELNTCRGRTVEDWRWVLGLYRDCGGRLLTLSTDAHRPQDVGKGLREAAELARELGFTHVAAYEGHEPILKEL
ncbi:MAG: histidinol-phosphatase HisJ family protein [Oscillospiraceae bacterium]|nr:histidinol-phosphatase HisJ family protein [Oscillospiraceae bacterium]